MHRNIYQFWVYIMSNYARTVLYIGVTNDLYRRYKEHCEGQFDGFTKRYHCTDLLYYEKFSSVDEAIAREKSLKGKSRAKKEALIREMNPTMEDLAIQFDWKD